MSVDRDDMQVATFFSEVAALARRLAEFDDRQDAACAVVDAAVSVLGCGWAAIVHAPGGSRLKVDAVSADGEAAEKVAHAISQLDAGLGRSVLTKKQTIHVCDLAAAADQWPEYVARMLAATPVRTALGLYLHLSGEELGALALYDARPGYFTATRSEMATAIADLAAVALSRAADRTAIHNLNRALESSRTIGQATGIVMSRYRISADAAFDALVNASQSTHRKLRDLAQDVIYTGDLST